VPAAIANPIARYPAVALVDAQRATGFAGPVGILQRKRQRGVTRARAQHHIADTAADQLVDDDPGLCRRWIHQSSLVGDDSA